MMQIWCPSEFRDFQKLISKCLSVAAQWSSERKTMTQLSSERQVFLEQPDLDRVC